MTRLQDGRSHERKTTAATKSTDVQLAVNKFVDQVLYLPEYDSKSPYKLIEGVRDIKCETTSQLVVNVGKV